jgi:hypothetical protein
MEKALVDGLEKFDLRDSALKAILPPTFLLIFIYY